MTASGPTDRFGMLAALDRVTILHAVALALLLRFIWVLLVPFDPISDSFVYDQLAKQIANGNGYAWPDERGLTAYWPVGTSALYGFFYAIFGAHKMVVPLLNLIMGAGLVFATYHLALARFSRRVAIGAALLLAIWPNWIAWTTVIASELPWIFLVATGLAIWLRTETVFSAAAILALAILSLSAFFRPIILPFIIALPTIRALRLRSVKELVAGVLFALAIMGAVLTPWAMRNAEAFGKPVPVSTNFGVNLWIGNNPEASGTYSGAPDPGRDLEGLNEVETSAVYQEAAIEFITQNPDQFLRLMASRAFQTFNRETVAVFWNANSIPAPLHAPLKVVMSGYWYFVLITGAIGLVLAFKHRRLAWYDELFAATVLITAVPILIFGGDRFHFGLAPFLAIFAAYLLCSASGDGSGEPAET